MTRTRQPFHPVGAGVLVVDKPGGMTSHDVVARLRRVTGERRIGHGGTLDPLATGVLPLLLASATRLLNYLPADPKAYRVCARLGIETATADIDGEVVRTARPAVTDAALARALSELVGNIEQVPPMFSAKKVGGRRLHQLARRGHDVARNPCRVRVDELRLVSRDGDDLWLQVTCSPGTYVRSLVADLGQALGCGATVAELRRERSGPFTAADAHPLAALDDADAVRARLTPLDRVPLAVDAVRIAAADEARFGDGRELRQPARGVATASTPVAVRSADDRLLGIAARMIDGDVMRLRPRVVLSTSR